MPLTTPALGLLLVVLIWGGNFTATKLAFSDISPLAFTAGVVRSSRRFSYVRGILASPDDLSGPAFATATGMVAPAK